MGNSIYLCAGSSCLTYAFFGNQPQLTTDPSQWGAYLPLPSGNSLYSILDKYNNHLCFDTIGRLYLTASSCPSGYGDQWTILSAVALNVPFASLGMLQTTTYGYCGVSTCGIVAPIQSSSTALLVECAAGYGNTGTSASPLMCQYCPAGYYSSMWQTSCSQCAPGTYSGTTASVNCISCPPGQIAPTAGLSSCSVCPSTTVPSSGGTSCASCPAGSSCANGISTLCPVGSYCVNSVEQPCPQGYSCPFQGMSVPDICHPGTYGPIEPTSTCALCPADTTSPGGTDGCAPCASGTHSSAGWPMCCPTGYAYDPVEVVCKQT